VSVAVVVGGQFGSEGKGKTVSLLAKDRGQDCAVVRCGGPNSGHIVVTGEREWRFRLLPASTVYGRRGFLAPAAVIDLEILRTEIEAFRVSSDLLTVDPYSVVISDEMKTSEQVLVESVASTGSGTGAATAAKCMRIPRTQLVKDAMAEHRWLRPFVRDVRSELHELVEEGRQVLIEGTQGFGLSLHHSRMFPHTTSKDTTAAQFVMEAGLSPLQVTEVILVIRTFPIRVAGEQAGPLAEEITWDQLREEAGAPHDLAELTTVTRKVRRVARFDLDLVKDACKVNRPTGLVVHGLDYLGWENHGVSQFDRLNVKARCFLSDLRAAVQVPIIYAFTGRDNAAVVRDVEPSLGCESLRPSAHFLAEAHSRRARFQPEQ
jgi:adenylosuccinate synthase